HAARILLIAIARSRGRGADGKEGRGHSIQLVAVSPNEALEVRLVTPRDDRPADDHAIAIGQADSLRQPRAARNRHDMTSGRECPVDLFGDFFRLSIPRAVYDGNAMLRHDSPR